MESIEIPATEDLQPVDGWQAFLQVLGHNVRRVAVEHPAAFPLIATRHPAAPWLRPPLRSLRMVEAFLTGLQARGFSEIQAVGAYRSFTSFLLGHLLLEAAMQGAPLAPAEEPLDEGDATLPDRDAELDVREFPTVARLRQPLPGARRGHERGRRRHPTATHPRGHAAARLPRSAGRPCRSCLDRPTKAPPPSGDHRRHPTGNYASTARATANGGQPEPSATPQSCHYVPAAEVLAPRNRTRGTIRADRMCRHCLASLPTASTCRPRG